MFVNEKKVVFGKVLVFPVYFNNVDFLVSDSKLGIEFSVRFFVI